MYRKNLFFLFIINLVSVLVFAQEKLDDISKQSYYFQIKDNKLIGKGSDILKSEISKSQFFILGEEHFSARVSEFTNAILPLLSESGFKYFAAEIGRNSTEVMTRTVEEKGSLYDFNTEINDLFGDIPIPFFDGKEDETFLKTALANGFEIWGIDQEYLTSQVFLVDEISRLSGSKKESEALYIQVKKVLIAETKKGISDGKYPVFTNLANSKAVNDFFGTIDSVSNPKAFRIISDLRKSWETYRLREVKDYYQSLHNRLDIMQSTFVKYYSNAIKKENELPKVFLKIGGKHASKGRSLDNIFDIGNFLMELANFNRTQSTTALIYPSAYLEGDGKTESNIDEEDKAWLQPILDNAKGKWVFINLKEIEKQSWKNKIVSASLKDYMYRFDYMIITPPSKGTECNFKQD
jgi:hypothetical protein